MVAKNKEHESNSSNVATITFDGSAMVDRVEDLKIIDKTNYTITLNWKKVDGADGYQVIPKPPQFYPHMNPQTTNSNTYTVKGLAPGVRYSFEVSATKNKYIGPSTYIEGVTKDQNLPPVTISEPNLLKSHGTTVKLSWDPPKSNRKIKWQYGVHYAIKFSDLYSGLFKYFYYFNVCFKLSK